MKFQIDLIVVAAYCGLTWAYAQLPDPNWWVFAFILLMTFAIDVRSYYSGLNRGGEIMQKIMRDTLDDKGWEIVRTKR
jgi:hypothetical protein